MNEYIESSQREEYKPSDSIINPVIFPGAGGSNRKLLCQVKIFIRILVRLPTTEGDRNSVLDTVVSK